MFRASFQQKIIEIINDSKTFLADDFQIASSKNDKARNFLSVTYLYDREYKFTCGMPSEKAGSYGKTDWDIIAEFFPGELTTSETTKIADGSTLLSAIKKWLTYLEAELIATPVQRKFREHKQEIDEITNRFGEIPDEFFSKEEAERLRNRLEDLEAKMSQELASSISDQTELQTKIHLLQKEFELLKSTIEASKKPGFVRAWATRASVWMRDPRNQKLIGTAVEAGQKLLDHK